MKKQNFTVICMTAAGCLLFCACAPFAKAPAPASAPAPDKKDTPPAAKAEEKMDHDKIPTAYDKPETRAAFHALSSVKAMKDLKTLSCKITQEKTRNGFILTIDRSGNRNEVPFPAPAQQAVSADRSSGEQELQNSAKAFHTLSHFDWESVAYRISAVPAKERTYLLKIRPRFKWYEGLDVQLTFDAQGRLVSEEVLETGSKVVRFSRVNTKFDQTGFPVEFKSSWKGAAGPDLWQISEVKRNTSAETTKEIKTK